MGKNSYNGGSTVISEGSNWFSYGEDIHTGRKKKKRKKKEPFSFKCPYCTWKAKRLENLTAHVGKKHPNNRKDFRHYQKIYEREYIRMNSFSCSYCSKRFGTKNALVSHMAAVHPQSQISYERDIECRSTTINRSRKC